jgi:PAS domain S-box-containing protein
MPRKPSYEELEQRVKELGKAVSDQADSKRNLTDIKEANRRCEECELKYRDIFENIQDVYSETSLDGVFLEISPSVENVLKYKRDELIGKPAKDIYADPDERDKLVKSVSSNGTVKDLEVHITDKDGSKKLLSVTVTTIVDEQGNPLKFVASWHDITDRKRMETELKKVHAQLEQRVQERTKELARKTKRLEAMNTAMEVLLEKRQKDKIDLKDTVLTNVKELIEPYFDRIKATNLDEQQQLLLSIIELNMDEIVSPFNRKISLKYFNLTPAEIKIVNMVKHGYTTKRIAKVINTSPRTVDTHRRNIRKKIGLKQKDVDLRSYLLSTH